ncbi:MAG: radical SAM protein [Deltaproteobacteria bacterium]
MKTESVACHIHSSQHSALDSNGPEFMSPEEIKLFKPHPWVQSQDMAFAVDRAKTRMEVAGVWTPNQILGRRYSIGCVALEITQRCNLDCTLCYLSEHSESVKDIPMEEIFRRIDQIKLQFGPSNDIQITGGDPTLRKRSELMEIVRYIRKIGMRPTLMTNGIAATRDMCQELVANGLNDIAFHVDLTQERKGYKTEMELNKFRKDYIERVRGLPIAVIFNTTVFKDNFHEIPDLIRFFRANTDVVGMASFQLQAETGRGVLRKRDVVISLDSVSEKIQEGAGIPISFDTARIGHPRCHKYGLTLESNGKLFDFFDDPELFNLMIEKTRTLELDRTHKLKLTKNILTWLFQNPDFVIPAVKFAFRKLWEMKWDILKSRRVGKLSFFIQNFMDASSLELDRIHACSFMVMTPQGPISMCMHNAKRDDYILQPIKLKTEQIWQPLTGKTEACCSEEKKAE